jgi:ATP-dependent DNA ligase
VIPQKFGDHAGITPKTVEKVSATISIFASKLNSPMLHHRPYLPCLPTRATVVPSGPDWLHEIKYDGYRVIVQRDGDRVRLSGGYDWSSRYSWIVMTRVME